MGAQAVCIDSQSAEYICEELCAAIEQIGPDDVVQVNTVSAAACVRAGHLVEFRCGSYPWGTDGAAASSQACLQGLQA